MTVEELIKALQTAPMNARVTIKMPLDRTNYEILGAHITAGKVYNVRTDTETSYYELVSLKMV